MKNLVTLILIIQSCFLYSQKQSELPHRDRLFVTIGASYSPSLFFDGANGFKGVKASYSPSFELTIGNRNFDVYAKSGELLEFGVRGGNSFLMGGIGYVINYNAPIKGRHIVFVEIGYHVEFKKGMFLFLSSKHGVLVEHNMYFFSPVNASLKFTINQ